MSSCRRREGGFTLLEVMVALTISAIALLFAHRVFSGVTDTVARMGTFREGLDRRENAHRWLSLAFQSVEIGTAMSDPFDGKQDRATFSSRLTTAYGWAETSRVSLSVDSLGLVVEHAGGTIVLRPRATRVAFDYLLEPGADARWVNAWSSAVSAPLAVRMRVGEGATTDTTLFLVRARG